MDSNKERIMKNGTMEGHNIPHTQKIYKQVDVRAHTIGRQEQERRPEKEQEAIQTCVRKTVFIPQVTKDLKVRRLFQTTHSNSHGKDEFKRGYKKTNEEATGSQECSQ